MDEDLEDVSDSPDSPDSPDNSTARYRAGTAPLSGNVLATGLMCGDIIALAALTWSFSAWKNGLEGPGFLLSWHSLVVLAAVVISGYVVGLYQLARITRLGDVLIRILSASASTAVAMAVIVYVTAGWEDNLGPLGRIVLSQSLAVFSFWQLLSRVLALRYLRRRSGETSWLILASSGPSRVVVSQLGQLPEFSNFSLLLPDTDAVEANAGTWSELESQLGKPWTGIIMAQDQPLPDAVVEILVRARLGGARVMDLTDLVERMNGRVPLERIHQRWFLTSDGFDIVHSRNGLRLKRVMDLLVSLAALVLASPLMALAALLVAATSRGPVLFHQQRVGRRGRPFAMHKFRTMRRDAEAAGAQWATQGDPRVTAVGRVLRAVRIDELPQLWNILRGEMSFIGPRPERPEFISTLESSIPFYSLRHLVKPGLTGWAQVCFPYGASVEDAKQKLEYDLYYIKNHSLILDLFILLRTVRVVIHRQGAR